MARINNDNSNGYRYPGGTASGWPDTDEVCAQINLLPDRDAEPDTDEIYAEITLLPDHDQSGVQSFCKILTTSETSKNGEISLPRRHAVDCVPPLNVSQQPPWPEMVASDLQDNEWHFRHMLQGHPSVTSFLTTGWSDFVNAKKLVPGDAFVFLLGGGNGELCVGVRRRMNHTPSVTSSQTHLAILATASHAITSGTRFLVTYRPRASPSPFIISLNKYLEAQSYDISVGMKFEMKFEGEDVLERRFSGTIVGVGETASSKWPDSEWRSLKRVSPQELDHLASNSSGSQPHKEVDVEIAC